MLRKQGENLVHPDLLRMITNSKMCKLNKEEQSKTDLTPQEEKMLRNFRIFCFMGNLMLPIIGLIYTLGAGVTVGNELYHFWLMIDSFLLICYLPVVFLLEILRGIMQHKMYRFALY